MKITFDIPDETIACIAGCLRSERNKPLTPVRDEPEPDPRPDEEIVQEYLSVQIASIASQFKYRHTCSRLEGMGLPTALASSGLTEEDFDAIVAARSLRVGG